MEVSTIVGGRIVEPCEFVNLIYRFCNAKYLKLNSQEKKREYTTNR
jgi:hypothetical protein